MRVAILYNVDGNLAAGTPADDLAVTAVVTMAREVAAACTSLGFTAIAMPAPEDPELICAALRSAKPDVVLNLCESLRGDARLESAVAGLLELVGIPFTGSGSKALALALDKPLAKAVMRDAGVPTPASRVLRSPGDDFEGLGYPVIVKPSREDASHGISFSSVCRSSEEVRARAKHVLDHYRQPALAEEFVDGREFNVALLQAGGAVRVLPLSEIDFSGFPAGRPKLITYEAKWVEESPEYRGSVVVAASNLPPKTEEQIIQVAKSAWAALGLMGYGRVDMRLCERRGPLVLEVNPNPDLSRDAGFARAAGRGGIAYEQLVGHILHEAQRR